MIDLGIVKPGSTIRIPFGSYDGATGASEAASNFADADILVYKNGSTTEVAGGSCGGTATTSFDSGSLTGINLVTLNLADNTTAGHWAAGAEYLVMVGPITIDTQIVYLALARFVIGLRDAVLNTTISGAPGSQTSFVLASGPAEDDALNGCVVYLHDVASAVQGGFAVISDYTGASKTVTLAAATTYTIADTDNVCILPPDAAWLRLGAPAGASISADVAAVKSDTTSILSKLLKYVQLILRKDAAIATDNATELTAINADGGSGAGAYANTTDSQEALRDRGDVAWITATGFSTLDAAGVRAAVGLASADLDTQLTPLANLPSGIKKNTALANFEFLMVLSSDHYTAATGLTVAATRSLDGAAFGACANAVTEVSNGIYKIDLDAGDLNGDTVTLRFTSATADDRDIFIITEP